MKLLSGRSIGRDVTYVVAWAALYISMFWRWVTEPSSSILFPIVWSIYTVLSLIVLVRLVRDWRTSRRKDHEHAELPDA